MTEEQKKEPVNIDLRSDNPYVFMYRLKTEDTVYYTGSSNQFKGQKRTVVFSVAVNPAGFTNTIQRVGFRGTDNDAPLENSVPQENGKSNIYNLRFEIYNKVFDQVEHRIHGSFFIETADGTCYWYKHNALEDFSFDSHSRFLLSDFR